MKKNVLLKTITYFTVLVILVTNSLVLFACNNKEDEFITVVSIKFVSDGKTITEKSCYYTRVSNSVIISRQEFREYSNSGRDDIIVRDDPPWYFSKDSMLKEKHKEKIAKGNLKIEEKLEPVHYYPDIDDLTGYYWLHTVSAYIYYYVQVKIIDNETITIKKYNGETTYKVTSYSITKFKE